MNVYVAYWDKELTVPTTVTATLTLANGTVGQAVYELPDSWKNWQGTMQIFFALRYDDLSYFKQAVRYELDFGDKVMTIPMNGFSSAIDRALADAD
jgi:hypothetical protein